MTAERGDTAGEGGLTPRLPREQDACTDSKGVGVGEECEQTGVSLAHPVFRT